MKRETGSWINIEVTNFREKDPYISIRITSSHSYHSSELVVWLKQFESYEAAVVGSSLKFCMVAEVLTDFYPRFGPTYIWDTVVEHALVIGAGGKVMNKVGTVLAYDN